MAHPDNKPTAVERLKAYGILGVASLALLKLPLVLTVIGAAAAVGIS